MRKVLLLGASGSIGTQTLDILAKRKDRFELVAFSLGKRIEKIPEILKKFRAIRYVCVQRESDCIELRKQYQYLKWYWGDAGLAEIISACRCDMVVNALVGFSGLVPSVTSLRLNKVLCLANKESLVVGGALIRDLLSHGSGQLIPIDSEHVAIDKLLTCIPQENVSKLLITASGGSFRDKTRKELKDVTPEMALNHPTWSMGAKITIDSATMMNKGFEVIEAKWLFDFPLEKTEILMHRESHMHSALLLNDGTYIADVSVPDMHGPIEYALMEREVDFSLKYADSLSEFKDLHFGEFDKNRYPAVELALKAFRKGGNACAVLNAANEEAVYAFLDHRLAFLEIEPLIQDALKRMKYIDTPTLDDLIRTDALTREFVIRETGGKSK
ncbi:MAG: 1-deoxy-D-xylulose-5-phosphate reductoisomerase [Bacilli bacterium]|nr:1-deoxy-D-xylulose-5-phosphate reductoisomerase [Bacilli bacterium]